MAKMFDCTEMREAMARLIRHYAATTELGTEAIFDRVRSELPKMEPPLSNEEMENAIVAFNLKTEADAKKALKEMSGDKTLTASQKAAVTEAAAAVEAAEQEQKPSRKRMTKVEAIQKTRKAAAKMQAENRASPHTMRNLAQRIARLVVPDIETRAELVEAVHAELAEFAPPGWTVRDTMDAISGYGDFRKLNKEEMAVKLRDLKGQMQQVAKLEDMIEKGQAPLKTGIERRAPSDEERRLIHEVNEAKKKLNIPEGDPETQLATTLQTRKKRLSNQIADLEHQIATGRKATTEKVTPPTDAQAEELIRRRDELKAEFDRAFNVKGEKDAKRIAELRQQIADVEQQIATEQIPAPPGKKPDTRSPEIQELSKELAERRASARRIRTLKEAIESMREQLRTSNPKLPVPRAVKVARERVQRLIFEKSRLRSRLDRMIEKQAPWSLGDYLSLPNHIWKSLQATMDASFIGRQGAINLLSGRFKLAARSFMAQFRAFRSDDALARHTESIMNRPNGPIYKQAGLEIADHAEEFESRILEKFRVATGIAFADRAFVAAGNQMRADLFDTFYESMGGNVTKNEAKHIARMVNDMTLRGTMEPGVAKFLNNFLFSARALKARIAWLSGAPIWRAPTRRTRNLALRQYGRFLIGATTVWLLAKMLGMLGSDDPRSSDFLKIKAGDTRLDMFGGLTQFIVAPVRTITGKTVNREGKVVALRGEDRPYAGREVSDVIFDFARSKLSPGASFAMDAVTGKEYGGTPFDARRAILSRSIPLSLQQLWEIGQEEGVPKTAMVSALSLLGVGVNQYEKDGMGKGAPLPNAIIRMFGGTPNQKETPKKKSSFKPTFDMSVK